MASKRILILGEDIEFCEELSAALKDYGYLVSFKSDFLNGANVKISSSYDTVLVDLKARVLTEIDILKKLKTSNIIIPIFIITGRPIVEQKLKEEHLLGMVKGIINKPVDLEELLQKIKEL